MTDEGEPHVTTTDEPKPRPRPLPPAAPAKPGRPRAVTAVVAVLGLLLLAATVTFALLYVNARDDRPEQDAARATVLTVAQKAAVDFSSYDYRDLDADFSRVASQLTPSFRNSYRKTANALKATLTQYKAVGTAKVLDAGVASLSASKATVVVFLDQTVTSSSSTTPTVDRNRIRVRLQKSGDRWLVSALDLR